MASVIDDAVVQALNTDMAKEAAAAGGTRTRAWDMFSLAVAQNQITALATPTVLAGQGIRMLNGTPTSAPLQAPEAQKVV